MVLAQVLSDMDASERLYIFTKIKFLSIQFFFKDEKLLFDNGDVFALVYVLDN